MVFVDRTLLSYSIVLPLGSQVYLSLEYALRSLREDEDDTLTNQIIIIFSTLMSLGWIVNTAFWTHCELYATNIKMCPLKIRQPNPVNPFSTAKVALGSTITVFFAIHTGFSVQELRENNKKRRLVGNGGLLVRANVSGDKVQEMAEDDGNSDNNLFHQDPVIPSKICV
jgi:hypothetical protein